MSEEKSKAHHPLQMGEDWIKMFNEIYDKEPDAAKTLFKVVEHIHGTYDDKYEREENNWLRAKALLLSKNGKYPNVHSAGKYIQRYSTEGFEKSENPADLRKAIHYLVFELQRRLKFK